MKLACSSKTFVEGYNTYAVLIRYNPEIAVIKDGIIIQEDTLLFVSKSVESYSIPSNIKTIGEYAFKGCSGLTEVIIPNSVTSIGEYAFKGCSGLKKSAYPNTLSKNPFPESYAIAYNPEGAIIEDGWIYGPEKTSILYAPLRLEGEYTVPETVTSIGNNAFRGCSDLTGVKTLAVTPPTMQTNSFEGLYDTVKLDVPKESVSAYLSSDWSLFKNINGNKHFAYSDDVLKYRLLPAPAGSDERNIAVIISDSYTGDISVPERFAYTNAEGEYERYYVEGIGSGAFQGSSITGISFNSKINLKYIGELAFGNCQSLSSITIPNTVTTIGRSAFAGSGLKKAEFADIESLCSIEFGNLDSNPLYCAHHLYIDGAEVQDAVIPETVSTISYAAFAGCSNLKSVTIGPSVASIGQSAFRGCSALTSVTIPNSVTSIGQSAFSGCRALAEVTIPDLVTSISDFSFQNCSGLKTLTIGSSVTSIGYAAFSDCSGLKTLTIGSSVTSIDSLAFSGCRGLKTLTIGSSVTSIGYAAFSGCSGLTELATGDVVKTIGSWAFSGCIGLKTLTIGSSVTSIGSWAFSGCSGLTNVTIGKSIASIDASIFHMCWSVSNLTIADGSTPLTIADADWLDAVIQLYMGRTIIRE